MGASRDDELSSGAKRHEVLLLLLRALRGPHLLLRVKFFLTSLNTSVDQGDTRCRAAQWQAIVDPRRWTPKSKPRVTVTRRTAMLEGP